MLRPLPSIGFVLTTALLTASCSGGGSVPGASTAAKPLAVPATPFPQVSGDVDDWVTFAHDQARTGFEPQKTGITKANVGGLALRWSVSLGESVSSSPLVANGVVYVAGGGGRVRALSAATGSTLWTFESGGQVAMTPLLDGGLLFIGVHAQPGVFEALDASSGDVVWSATLPGAIRAEPAVLDGEVYIGDASGDPPACNQGGLHAFNELNGAPGFVWYDDLKPNDGGAIWNPISTDGTSLFFGTGNTCSPNVADGNAVIKLSTAGTPLWTHNEANPLSDDDFGSAVTIVGDQAIASDKNGVLYAFDRLTGSIVFSDRLGNTDGYGSVGSLGTDGALLVVDGGYASDPTKTSGNPGGFVYGVSRSGAILWRVQNQAADRGSIAMIPGVAFLDVNGALEALDSATGATLWSYSFGTTGTASPAVVPSGVYVADSGGKVYAFALPAAASNARRAANPRRP